MSNPPLLSPVFSRTGGLLKFIPYPDYADPALLAWDLTTEFAAIVAAQADATTALAAANEADDTADAAQATANTALTNAATALTAANEADDTADAAQAAADAAQASASSAATSINQLNFLRFAFFGDEMNYSTGTPTRTITASYPYNWVVSTTTDGAACSFQNLMDNGTWEINILTAKANNFGKLNVVLDGVSIVTNLDLYAAATSFAFLHTITGVSLSGADKVREWGFSVNGKNASSSSFAMVINKVWGRKTGA